MLPIVLDALWNPVSAPTVDSWRSTARTKIRATDQVYFNPRRYATLDNVCRVSMRARPLMEQAPDTESFEISQTSLPLNGQTVTTKSSWTRQNKVSRDTASSGSAAGAR